MSNVIIVEDDEKVIREVTQFVMEINGDNKVRVFKTPEQFLKRYTKTSNSENSNSDTQNLYG